MSLTTNELVNLSEYNYLIISSYKIFIILESIGQGFSDSSQFYFIYERITNNYNIKNESHRKTKF